MSSRSPIRRPGWNYSRYKMAVLAQLGGGNYNTLISGATPVTGGYDFAPPPSVAPSAIYWRPMTDGAYYWEQIYAAAHILPGIIDDYGNTDNYGGWTDNHSSQIYSSGWVSRNWVTAEEAFSSPPALNGRICFLYNADTKIMSYGVNGGAAQVVHDVSHRGNVPMYAIFAFQSATQAKLRFGPEGCAYAPPVGARYL